MDASPNSPISVEHELGSGEKLTWMLMCLGLLLFADHGRAQSAGSTEAQVQSIFATSVVLTDSDAIRFGMLRFNPSDILEPLDDDQFGSAESIERRQSAQLYALPGSWTVGKSDAALAPYIKTRLSYLSVEQEAVLTGQDSHTQRDRGKERVYGAYVEGGFSYQLSSHWEATLGAGTHLLQYDSAYQEGGLLSKALQSASNSLAFDTRATALMGELETQLSYTGRIDGIPWRFRSTYSYLAGETVKVSDGLEDVNPETWSWTNEAAMQWPMPKLLDTESYLQFSLRRVDLGGDVARSLGTHDYYGLGVGWVFEGPESLSWLNNVGVNLFVNWGSAFSGGSVDVLFNEQF
jgi:hypothetical protein